MAVLLAAVVFAFNGGQYSQREYQALRRQEDGMRVEMDSLRRAVDSLRAFRDSLVSMPAVQERVARERLGMVRPGEILILLVPDAAPAAP